MRRAGGEGAAGRSTLPVAPANRMLHDAKNASTSYVNRLSGNMRCCDALSSEVKPGLRPDTRRIVLAWPNWLNRVARGPQEGRKRASGGYLAGDDELQQRQTPFAVRQRTRGSASSSPRLTCSAYRSCKTRERCHRHHCSGISRLTQVAGLSLPLRLDSW